MKMRKVLIREKETGYGFTEIAGIPYIVSEEYTDTKKIGIFHEWVTKFSVRDGYGETDLYAVIEMADGTIQLYEYDLIKFIEEVVE